jgi:hypothetical protein
VYGHDGVVSVDLAAQKNAQLDGVYVLLQESSFSSEVFKKYVPTLFIEDFEGILKIECPAQG